MGKGRNRTGSGHQERCLRVIQVVGSFPPEPCGIGDYTARLTAALAQQGVEAVVLTRHSAGDRPSRVTTIDGLRKWSLSGVAGLLRVVRGLRPDLIHVQYPGLGYGYSLAPHLLTAFVALTRIPVVVTLHEYERAHWLRRLSEALLAACATSVVFTTSQEQAHAVRRIGWLVPSLHCAHVIVIGSNLPEGEATGAAGYNRSEFSYWGMFHPGKGIEKVLGGFALAVRRAEDLRLTLVGARRQKDERYIERLQELVDRLGVRQRVMFCFDLSGEDTIGVLKRCCAVILPYGDGATFRRGTLVAALRLGLPVVSTRGPDTPSELVDERSILFAADEGGIADLLLRLRSESDLRDRLSSGAAALGERFDWRDIACRHMVLYEKLAAHRKG